MGHPSLWRVLERMTIRSGVRKVWENALGEWSGAVEPYLRVRSAAARSYPCTESVEGCARRIVVHEEGDIVAICGMDPSACSPMKVTKGDVAVYEFTLNVLGAHLAAVFGLSGSVAMVPDIRDTASIGIYVPFSGCEYNAFLSFQSDPEELSVVLERLRLRTKSPWVLFTPTRDLFGSTTTKALSNDGVVHLALDEIVSTNSAGSLELLASPEELLSPLSQRAERDIAGVLCRFPTPPGSTWSELSVMLNDGHTITAALRAVSQRLSFAQIGLANLRNAEPTKQWQLLTSLAEHRGAMPKSGGPAVEKQRQSLRKALQTFFGIAGDPFEISPDGSWRACFRIRSEA